MKIFVGIVSTEDPNLVETIKDCLKNSLTPENITFGIALQYENMPDLSFIDSQCRTILLDKDDDSLGIIGARRAVRKLHRDEDYYMQINSDTKFAKNWDDLLIHDLELFKDKKTIISSKLFPIEDKTKSHVVFDLNVFDEEDMLCGVMSEDEEFIKLNSNGKNYFNSLYISNDFIFARARWIYEMKFPEYHKDSYENVELSIVSFCNGYTIVSPKSNRRLVFGNPKRTMTVIDTPGMHKDVARLLIIGKNKHFDLTQNIKQVSDFYKAANISKQYKKSYPLFIGAVAMGEIKYKPYYADQVNKRLRRA